MNRQLDARPLAGFGRHPDLPTDLVGALAHVGETIMAIAAERAGIGWKRESLAVILHGELRLSGRERQRDVDDGAFSAMLAGVGDRLLQHAEEGQRALGPDLALAADAREAHVDPVPPRRQLAVVAQ